MNHTSPSHIFRRDDDPADFSWIKRWAVIGDSFTAGIGAGHPMGDFITDVFMKETDWLCSRYDQSYPMVLKRAFGHVVKHFEFAACSGARSEDIYSQAEQIDGSLDLVVMTAGGNDLCLAEMIKKCIFLPSFSSAESNCQTIINKAQENIDTILKPNLKQILEELDGRMNDDSIVVFNGYAQFFNTENEDCAKKQHWIQPRFLSNFLGLDLTVDRRNKFNQLVVNINKAIKSVVHDVSENSGVRYTLGFSDWDPWVYDGVAGQFCDPSSDGRYPDNNQPDLHFFKPDTYIREIVHDELKRREYDEDPYDNILWKSPNPAAASLHKLDPRAPSPPRCPDDGKTDWTGGLGLPDSFGKNFHPNELGHVTIASFAMDAIIRLRAQVLGKDDSEACKVRDDFKCWQKEGRKAYASADRLNENYKDFCNNVVQQPKNTLGWHVDFPYHKGTPDEHSFRIQLSDAVADYNKDECIESMDRIINGCDGNDANNPMNWKFGGRWVRGEYTYEVTPNADYRPQLIQKTDGACEGWYHVFYSSYVLYGKGFSDYDWGQKTLLPSIKGCLGLGVTAWRFDYLNPPTDEGWEWKASFNTPIFVRHRCFTNNKVVKAAGGWTNGCGGNDG